MTLGKRYELLEEIGRGEMGVVYKARQIRMEKIVAVKILLADIQADASSLQRFLLEARAIGMLNHSNIIPILDLDFMPEGLPFLVMEYLEAPTLGKIIDTKGQLEIGRALSICIQLCSALCHAHSRNIVHRDIKPSNVIICRDEESNGDKAILLDFGIAKVFSFAGRTLQKLTTSGQIFTSPLYMSPEQCMGQFSDVRSDIYALACLLYNMLCGSPPFAGGSYLQTVFMHVNEQPDALCVHCPPGKKLAELNATILKALSKNPDNRQQTSAELKKDLEAILEVMQREFPVGSITVDRVPLPPKKEPAPQPQHTDNEQAEKRDIAFQGTPTAKCELGKPISKPPQGIDYTKAHNHSPDKEQWWKSQAAETDDGDMEEDEQDPSLHRTIRDLLKRAKRGQASDMYDLAWHYRNGDLVKKSVRRAWHWFLKAGEAGDDDAMIAVGNMYFDGGCVNRNPQEGLRWYQRAADKGNAWGMVSLADTYTGGFGIEENREKAVYWYGKAAEKGEVEGMKELARFYEDGYGVEKNLSRAADWWLSAAKKGDKHAQLRIGVCFRYGIGVGVDLDEAVGWFQCSAGQGYCFGKIELARCFAQGIGVQQDVHEAERLLMQAAQDGCPDAQSMLDQPSSQVQSPRATNSSIPQNRTADTHSERSEPPAGFWGAHHRFFYVRPDGQAEYLVKSGETLQQIVKDVQREINRNTKAFATDPVQLETLIKMIDETNGRIRDFELYAGRLLKIPTSIVRQVMLARGEKLCVYKDGKIQEIYYPDGTQRKILRHKSGEVYQVEDSDVHGQLTTYRKQNERWLVLRPGENEYAEYKGDLKVD